MPQIGYGGFLGFPFTLGTADINKTYIIGDGTTPRVMDIEFNRTDLLGLGVDVTNTEWDKYTLTEVSDPGNIGTATLINGKGDTDMVQPDGLDLLGNSVSGGRNDWQHDTFHFTLDTSSAAWKNLAVGQSLTVEYKVSATEYTVLGTTLDSDTLTIKLTFVKTCFDAATMIRMADGTEKRADAIVVGDMVATADHGAQSVRWVGRNTINPAEMAHFPSWRPVRIAAGALGNGLPTADLTVSQLHRVILRGEVAREAFGTDELLIPARFLTALDGIDMADASEGADLVHFMFDNHEIVTSNGARSESFCVSPLSRSQIGAEQLAELEALFPELGEKARNGRHDLARPVAREGFAEGIVAQLRERALPLQ